MPTVDASRQPRLRRRVVNTTQLPAGGLSAEARAKGSFAAAMGHLGSSIGAFGERLRRADEKAELLEQVKQQDDASLAMQEVLDKDAVDRTKNQDYLSHLPNFQEKFKAEGGQILKDVTNPTARENATREFQSLLSSESLKIHTDAVRSMAAEEKLRLPIVAQGVVDAQLGGDKKAISRWNDRNETLKKAGVFTEGEVDERNRILVMMKAQTVSARFPEAAGELMRNKSNMVTSDVFTEEEVALLSNDDMDDLQAGAKDELEAQQADAKDAAQEQNEKLSRELQSKIIDPAVPIAKTQAEFLAASREGKLTDVQIRVLNGSIEGRIANAGKTASPVEQSKSSDEYYTLKEDGKLDEAHAVVMRDSWMHTPSTTNTRLAELSKARTNPEETSDTTVKDGVTAINNIYGFRQTYEKKKEPKKGELLPESKLELEQLTKLQEWRQWNADKPDATPQQQADKLEAMLKPVEEEEARKWYQRLAFLMPNIRTNIRGAKGAVERVGEIIDRKSTSGKEVSGMTDEELRAIIEGK